MESADVKTPEDSKLGGIYIDAGYNRKRT